MLTYARQAIRNYRMVGSIAPSSPLLARAMIREVARSHGQKRVLEVGCGSGAFTQPLLDALRPGDEATLVEINQAFCDKLESKLLTPFRAANPGIRVTLHCSAIEDVELRERFDFIVCGLPFHSLRRAHVQLILHTLLDALSENGVLSFFEYVGMWACKTPLMLGPRGRRSVQRRYRLYRVLKRKHAGTRRLVLRNVPPAYVIKLRASEHAGTSV